MNKRASTIDCHFFYGIVPLRGNALETPILTEHSVREVIFRNVYAYTMLTISILFSYY